MLVKADKWLVLQDGTCMNMDTGGIMWASKNSQGQKCFKLVDDKGKVHFYLQRDLLKERNEIKRVENALAAQMDYEEYGDKVISQHIHGTPQIVEDFQDSIEVSYEEANKKLKDSIVNGKSKEEKLKNKEVRDNIKTIMDFIDS